MKPSHHDQLLHSLAAFTVELPATLDAQATEAALAVVQDSLSVALGALQVAETLWVFVSVQMVFERTIAIGQQGLIGL